MRIIAYPFMLLAGIGFLLSLTAHVLALFGKGMPGGGLVWTLHGGIFLVWIPAILLSKWRLRNVPAPQQVKAVFSACPIWMRRAIKLLFAYAIVNFLLFMASTTGHMKSTGSAPPTVVRGFSGHWMIFYAVAFVSFYSAIKTSLTEGGIHEQKPGGARTNRTSKPEY
jgi:hypothetical protein